MPGSCQAHQPKLCFGDSVATLSEFCGSAPFISRIHGLIPFVNQSWVTRSACSRSDTLSVVLIVTIWTFNTLRSPIPLLTDVPTLDKALSWSPKS
eukprot:2379192-Amphidinium_carterae.1